MMPEHGSLRHRERHIIQRIGRTRRIAEAHVLEGDLALDGQLQPLTCATSGGTFMTVATGYRTAHLRDLLLQRCEIHQRRRETQDRTAKATNAPALMGAVTPTLDSNVPAGPTIAPPATKVPAPAATPALMVELWLPRII